MFLRGRWKRRGGTYLPWVLLLSLLRGRRMGLNEEGFQGEEVVISGEMGLFLLSEEKMFATGWSSVRRGKRLLRRKTQHVSGKLGNRGKGVLADGVSFSEGGGNPISARKKAQTKRKEKRGGCWQRGRKRGEGTLPRPAKSAITRERNRPQSGGGGGRLAGDLRERREERKASFPDESLLSGRKESRGKGQKKEEEKTLRPMSKSFLPPQEKIQKTSHNGKKRKELIRMVKKMHFDYIY